MKAIAAPNFGGPEVLRIEKAPLPQIPPDDLLVRVYAAGVNRADLTFRKGGCGRVNFGDSETIGLEVAAEVEAVGVHAAKSFKLGDRVMGIVGGGGYAEFARLNPLRKKA